MSVTKKGWDQKLMMSFFKKESAYDAAVTVNSTNFCQLVGHQDFNPDWADKVESDKDTVTGYEFGTDQEIVGYGFKYQHNVPRAKPNDIIGGVALCLGDITSTQEGGFAGRTHAIIPVATGTALPSINAIGAKATKQYLYKGIKGAGFEIKLEEDKPVSFTVDLLGSGTRATNADSFASKITESWLRTNPAKIWIESGADISIDTTPTQGAQAISSSTPDDISSLVKSLSLKFNNNLEEQRMGNSGAASDIDFGRRSMELSIGMRWADYITLYENQTVIALDVDCKGGAKIDAGGTLYYGFKFVIPQLRLKSVPRPEGGVNDIITITLNCDVEENGTNKPIYFWGFNGITAYLAA